MAQNIHDNPEFFEGYSRCIRGRRVLDLGCGYGWFCRWAHKQGAARVAGIDSSERIAPAEAP